MLPRSGLYVVAFGDSRGVAPRTGSPKCLSRPPAAFLRGSDGNDGFTWAISQGSLAGCFGDGILVPSAD